MGSDPKEPRPWTRGPGVTRRGQAGVDDPGSDIFFAAIETSPVPMVLSDPSQPDNPIVFANQAFSALTGYGRREILGRNCRFLQGVDTDPGAIDDLRRAIRGRHELSTEVLNYRKDGSAFWNALFVSPVFDGSGELVYFFASQLDVSRRRSAEDALRGGGAPGITAAQATDIAHDLNNLLQVISGTADLMQRRAATADDPRLLRQIGIVAEAADRAAALTRRLADAGGRPDRDAPPRSPTADPAGAAAPAPSGGAGDAKGERILVVDDRQELAELARTMLEGSGYAVEIAVDGEEALAKLDGGFDLLFSDLVMPGGMDGLTLARRARARQPALKVLLTTGQAEEGSVPDFATIIKPYRRSELARRIRLALDGGAGEG